jgi:hypothetical protein
VHRRRDFVFVDQVEQRLLGVGRVAGREAFAAFAVGTLLGDIKGVVLGVDRDLFDLAGGDQATVRLRGDQFVVRRSLAGIWATDHLLGNEGKDHHQQDRESRALEKTPHREKSAYQGGFAI